jgi:integrase
VTKVNSIAFRRNRKPEKPKKPHQDYPLTSHPNGQWCKKVRGKVHFFGVWADPQAALDLWLFQRDDLLAGRLPRQPHDSRSGQEKNRLHYLLNRFYTAKKAQLDAGKLSPYTFQAYIAICDELKSAIDRERSLDDIGPQDFEILRNAWEKRWGDERLAAEINRARTVFNFGWKNGILDRPMQFGDGFTRPSKKALRLNKAAKGPKMFEADELRRMIEAARQPMKAMLLLGINAGLGNNDVAQLPLTAVDLKAGWCEFPRPKTGIMRRCPLWPETAKAIEEWLTIRPVPKDEPNAALVFLTVRGDGWGTNINDRPITHECRKLLDRLGINGNRNFYALRHTFETIGGDSRDQVAVDAIMGHDNGSMASNYRERISDERLQAVAEHIRRWLFPPKAKSKPTVNRHFTR